MDKIVAYAGQIGLRIILDHHSLQARRPRCRGPVVHPRRRTYTEQAAGSTTGDAGHALRRQPHRHRRRPAQRTARPATWGDGNAATDWRLAAERAGNAILAANPNWLIFVEGIENYNGNSYWWGGNLSGAGTVPGRAEHPRPAGLLAARLRHQRLHRRPGSATPAIPTTCPPSGTSTGAISTSRTSRPVWLGEFGTKLHDHQGPAVAPKLTAYMNGDFTGTGRAPPGRPAGHQLDLLVVEPQLAATPAASCRTTGRR